MSKNNKETLLNKSYVSFLQEIKQRLQTTRIQISRAANTGVMELYWWLGEQIVLRQEKNGWGKAVVEKLADDLRQTYGRTCGFSARNLWDMRHIYLEYRDYPNLRCLVAEIPWSQNLVIMAKIKDPFEKIKKPSVIDS